MGYTTAKTNWVATDYFNIADWTRIYNNAQLVSSLAEAKLGAAISFALLDDPTIATDPTTIPGRVNTLLANIENIRAAMASLIPTLNAIKYDWLAGVANPAPSYVYANQWELTLDTIWTYYSGSSIPVCPVLSSNLTATTGNQVIYIDCLDMADYNADLQGTAKLFII